MTFQPSTTTMGGGSDLRLSGMGPATSAEDNLSHLPPPETKRWVVSRKAQVVDAVRKGLLTLADACQRYTLSEEEIRSWMKLCERGGSRALRVTRLQDYRRKFRGDAQGRGAITG